MQVPSLFDFSYVSLNTVAIGGVSIAAGGLSVKGGLTLDAGSILSLEEGQVVAQTLAAVNHVALKESLLSATSFANYYNGNLIEGSVASSHEDFSFLKFIRGSNEVLRIDSEGGLTSTGGLHIRGSDGLTVVNDTKLFGGLYFKKLTLSAADKSAILVPNSIATDVFDVGLSFQLKWLI